MISDVSEVEYEDAILERDYTRQENAELRELVERLKSRLVEELAEQEKQIALQYERIAKLQAKLDKLAEDKK